MKGNEKETLQGYNLDPENTDKEMDGYSTSYESGASFQLFF